MSATSTDSDDVKEEKRKPHEGLSESMRGGLALLAAFLVALAAQGIGRSANTSNWWLAFVVVLLAHGFSAVAWLRISLRAASGSAHVLARSALAFAVAVWSLLAIELMHRVLLGALLEFARSTVWEGLVTGTVGSLVAATAGLCALGAWIAWRAIAFAVLEGRLSLRVPVQVAFAASLSAAYVGCALIVSLASFLATGAQWWVALAAALSLAVDTQALAVLSVVGSYVATLFALDFIGGARPARFGPLVLIDVAERIEDISLRGRQLLRLAVRWGPRRGLVILVRPLADVREGGPHSLWAQASGQLDSLLVLDDLAARRWAARWGARAGAEPSRLFLREAFVAAPALAALVEALRLAPGAHFVLVPMSAEFGDGHGDLASTETLMSRLRHALPKARSVSIRHLGHDRAGRPQSGLAVLDGRIDRLGHVDALIESLERWLAAPPSRVKLAVLGRPCTDRTADALVQILDQNRRNDGSVVDAQRPLRSAGADRFDAAIVLVDSGWLRGELDALAELSTVGTLLSRATSIAAVATAGPATAADVITAAGRVGLSVHHAFGGMEQAARLDPSSGLDVAQLSMAWLQLDLSTTPMTAEVAVADAAMPPRASPTMATPEIESREEAAAMPWPSRFDLQTLKDGGTHHLANDPSLVDLTIEIAKPDGSTGNGRFLCYLHSSHARSGIGPFPIDLDEDAKTFAKSIVQQIRDFSGDRIIDHLLRSVGGVIADRLPAEVFSALRLIAQAVAPRVPSVLLVSADSYVPWELAAFDPPLDPSRPPYLGAQTVMGRWLRDPRDIAAAGAVAARPVARPPAQPPSTIAVRHMAVMAGLYKAESGLRNLPEAEAEAKALAKSHGAVTLAANLTDVKRMLDAKLSQDFNEIGGFDAIHFAGHGDFDPAQPDSSVLMLSEGRPLSPIMFRAANYGGANQPQPLFFLNGCMIGMGGELLGDMGGFPGNCLKGGFGGVIGALWEVDDKVAHQIALEFWERALPASGAKGQAVGEILRDIRSKYSDAAAEPESTYLAYVYYGHPRLTLQRLS